MRNDAVDYMAAVAAFQAQFAQEHPGAIWAQPAEHLSRLVDGNWHFYNRNGYLGQISEQECQGEAEQMESASEARLAASGTTAAGDEPGTPVRTILEAQHLLGEGDILDWYTAKAIFTLLERGVVVLRSGEPEVADCAWREVWDELFKCSDLYLAMMEREREMERLAAVLPF